MRRWTTEETAYLRKHYNGSNAQEVAQALGRTVEAVKCKSVLVRRGLVSEFGGAKDRSRCRGCIFRQKYSGHPGCHYILYTGKMRPCPPERCTVRDTNRAHLEEYRRKLRFGGISEVVYERDEYSKWSQSVAGRSEEC